MVLILFATSGGATPRPVNNMALYAAAEAFLARHLGGRSQTDMTPAVAAQHIVEIGTGPPHHLLESLARTMLDALAARHSGVRFRLELRKLAPPGCPGSPDWAAVRLTHPPE